MTGGEWPQIDRALASCWRRPMRLGRGLQRPRAAWEHLRLGEGHSSSLLLQSDIRRTEHCIGHFSRRQQVCVVSPRPRHVCCTVFAEGRGWQRCRLKARWWESAGRALLLSRRGVAGTRGACKAARTLKVHAPECTLVCSRLLSEVQLHLLLITSRARRRA